jgi:hypothetical protein
VSLHRWRTRHAQIQNRQPEAFAAGLDRGLLGLPVGAGRRWQFRRRAATPPRRYFFRKTENPAPRLHCKVAAPAPSRKRMALLELGFTSKQISTLAVLAII